MVSTPTSHCIAFLSVTMCAVAFLIVFLCSSFVKEENQGKDWSDILPSALVELKKANVDGEESLAARIKRRKRKSTADAAFDDQDYEPPATSKPKNKRGRSKKTINDPQISHQRVRQNNPELPNREKDLEEDRERSEGKSLDILEADLDLSND